MKVYPSELTDEQLATILSYGSEAYIGGQLEYEDLGPGKFEDNTNPGLAEAIYERSLEGWADDTRGDVEEGLFAELLGRFILAQNDVGFVYLDEYPSAAKAREVFERIG